MPITFVHPIAVMPLRRFLGKHIVFSALVIGSMMPDMDHFLPLNLLGLFTHKISGIFEVAIPLGFVFFWIFHKFLKRPAIYLMPEKIQPQLQQFDKPFPLFNLKNFFRVYYSLGLGALTHIVWDAFTHETGFGVRLFPFLKTLLFQISQFELTIFKLLQHGGSILGTIFLIYACIKWLDTQPGSTPIKKYAIPEHIKPYIWCGMIFLPMICGAIGALYYIGWPVDYKKLRLFVRFSVVFSMSVFMIMYMLVGFGWKISERLGILQHRYYV